MSNYQTVFDLMAGSSSGKLFRGRNANDKISSGSSIVDCCEMELRALGLSERNIIAGLSIPDQFTGGDWEGGLEINCMSVATTERPGIGLVNLSSTKEHKLHAFRGSRDWLLKSDEGYVSYSNHTGRVVNKDLAIMGRVKSACTGMSAGEVDDLPMALIGERLTQDHDMRHIWIKMYLMLMDINLSVCARTSKRRGNPMRINRYHPGLSNAQILDIIAKRRIVVDADGMTGEELNLLSIASQAYPFIKYCGDNVYNTCRLTADDLAIVSVSDIEVDQRVIWAPSELYRLMVSIAAKFNDLDGLFDVVALMRGRPGHIRDVLNSIVVDGVGEVRFEDGVVYSGIPESTSYERALGRPTRVTVPANYPGYISTSAGLVADLMLSKCYELAASFVIERLGGYGDLLCREGAFASPMYNGLLRDYGISDMCSDNNFLMQQWESVSGHSYDWSLGEGWKQYILCLTHRMRGGIDCDMPQLTWDIAHLTAFDSVWATVRKWNGYNGLGTSHYTDLEGRKKFIDERNRLTASFTWAMGQRQQRPRLFVNAFTNKEVRLSSSELNWLAGSVGKFSMSHVEYTLGFEPHGREEWTEKAASDFVKAAVDGRKCTMIMEGDESGQWGLVELSRDDMIVSSTTEPPGDIRKSLGIETKSRRDDNVEDVVKPMVYNKPADDKMKEARKLFSRLRNINKEEKVKIVGAPQVEIGDSEKVRGRILKVPGDGRCGLHAVARSLEERGVIQSTERDRVFGNFDGMLEDSTFHRTEAIAGGLLNYGIGLRLYDRNDSGGYHVYEYGRACDQSISLIRACGHFDAFSEQSDGDVVVDVTGRTGEEIDPSEQLQAINEMNKWFESK